LFGLEKIALAFQEAGPHALENPGKIGDFISAARIERMMEIATLQGADTFDQVFERASERVRNEEDEGAADKDCGKTQKQQQAIDLI